MDKFKFTEAERDEISPFFRDNRMATMSDLLDRIETIISSRADGWVKIEDGLPGMGTTVIAFSKTQGIGFRRYGERGWWGLENKEDDVTHWMNYKIPQPPKTSQQ